MSGQDASLLRELNPTQPTDSQPLIVMFMACLEDIFCAQHQWDMCFKEDRGSVWMLIQVWQNCMPGQDASLLRELNPTQPTDS